MRIPQTPERIKEAPAQALRAVFAGVGQVLLMTERLRRRAMGQEHSQPVSADAVDTSDAPAPARDNGAHTATPGADQADQVKTGTTDPGATATSSAPPSAGSTSTAEVDASKTSATKASTTKASTAKTGTAKTGTAKAEPAKARGSSAKPDTTKAATSKTASAKTGTAKTGSAKATATTKPSSAKADTAPAEAATPATVTPAPAPADSASPEVRGTGVLPVPHYSELSVASLRARLRGLDIAQVRDLLAYERAHEDRANVIAMFERRIAKLEEAEGADPAAG